MSSEKTIKQEPMYLLFCPCGYTNGQIYITFPKYILCKECHKRIYDYQYIRWDEKNGL